jgi:O-antigen/teichoic acid export membrane protein
MVIIMSVTDVIVIGFYGDSSDISLYNAASKIAAVGALFLVLINIIISPKLAVLYESNRLSELKSIVNVSLLISSTTAIVIFVIIFLNAKPMLSFFGSGFERSVNTLILLSIGQAVLLATGPSSSFMMMCGQGVKLRKSSIYAMLLNLILNLILVPIFSIEGAAFSTSVSLVVKNIMNLKVMMNMVKI